MSCHRISTSSDSRWSTTAPSRPSRIVAAPGCAATTNSARRYRHCAKDRAGVSVSRTLATVRVAAYPSVQIREPANT